MKTIFPDEIPEEMEDLREGTDSIEDSLKPILETDEKLRKLSESTSSTLGKLTASSSMLSAFEKKSQTDYTYSSVHGVKGETFDALMLLIHGTRGNTLTPSFLVNGNTDTELMRIAYVAMTRPRKLLVIAMPKSRADLSTRFPKDKWEYIEL